MNSIVQAIKQAIVDGEEGYYIEGIDLVKQCEMDTEFIRFMNDSGFYSSRFANCINIIFDKEWEKQFKQHCAKRYPQVVYRNSKEYEQIAFGLLGGDYCFGYSHDTDWLIHIIEKTRKECYAKIEMELLKKEIYCRK